MYHETLRDVEQRRREAAHAGANGNEGLPTALHEAVRTKEEGLDRYLNYDPYRRASMLDHFLGPAQPWRTSAREHTTKKAISSRALTRPRWKPQATMSSTWCLSAMVT